METKRHENNEERIKRRQEIVAELTSNGMDVATASQIACDKEDREEQARVESTKPKTCQRKYLLCGHIYGDDNAEIKTKINQWCDACARELEHGHTPEAIKKMRGIAN